MASAFLLLAGADPSIVNPQGQTAADLARVNGHICPLKLLETKKEEVAAVREVVFNMNPPRGFLLEGTSSYFQCPRLSQTNTATPLALSSAQRHLSSSMRSTKARSCGREWMLFFTRFGMQHKAWSVCSSSQDGRGS